MKRKLVGIISGIFLAGTLSGCANYNPSNTDKFAPVCEAVNSGDLSKIRNRAIDYISSQRKISGELRTAHLLAEEARDIDEARRFFLMGELERLFTEEFCIPIRKGVYKPPTSFPDKLPESFQRALPSFVTRTEYTPPPGKGESGNLWFEGKRVRVLRCWINDKEYVSVCEDGGTVYGAK